MIHKHHARAHPRAHHQAVAARVSTQVTNVREPMTATASDDIARMLLHQDYAELAEAEQRLIDRIAVLAPPAAAPVMQPPLLDRAADGVANATRSWWFVAGFALVVAGWFITNAVSARLFGQGFDPYPYDMLKLVLTMVASVQGPIILISQQHAAAKDRAAAAHTKLEILRLHERLDGFEHSKSVPHVRHPIPLKNG